MLTRQELRTLDRWPDIRPSRYVKRSSDQPRSRLFTVLALVILAAVVLAVIVGVHV